MVRVILTSTLKSLTVRTKGKRVKAALSMMTKKKYGMKKKTLALLSHSTAKPKTLAKLLIRTSLMKERKNRW